MMTGRSHPPSQIQVSSKNEIKQMQKEKLLMDKLENSASLGRWRQEQRFVI